MKQQDGTCIFLKNHSESKKMFLKIKNEKRNKSIGGLKDKVNHLETEAKRQKKKSVEGGG